MTLGKVAGLKGLRPHAAAIRGRLVGEFSRASGLIDWFLIIAAFSAVAASYIVYMVRLPEFLTSDMAAEILTGREILKQKTLLLRDWYFSTEIFLVRTSLFIALWGLVTDSWLNAYRLAAATDVALICAAFAYMAKRLGASPKATAFGLLVFFGIRGYYNGQNTGLGGSSYGTLCATTFLILGYYAASRLRTLKRPDRILRWAIPVLAFLFGVSSMRFLAVVLIPLLAVHLAWKVWSRLPSGWTHDSLLREILLWNALCLGGWIITARLVMPQGFGPADYSTPYANGLVYIWRQNLPELLIELFHYNQFYTAIEPFRLSSLNGINGVLSIAFFMACGWLLFSTAKPYLATRRAVFLFFGISLAAAILSLFLFQPRINLRIRYLFIIYATMACATASGWPEFRRRSPIAARLYLLLAALLCVTNGVWNVRNIPNITHDSATRIAVRHVPETEESFKRHGISRGYALFWDSAVQAVLTDGRIEVHPLGGSLKPFRYLAPYSVFAKARSGEPTAFVRTRVELPPDLAALPVFNLTGGDVLESAYDMDVIPDPEADMEIYYFDHNPFTYPADHDPREDFAKERRERETLTESPSQ
ncbi:MAG: hypothetical protein LBR80_10355 [Deltaproteobacteria bacterium]|nr:hypothetical protein [Deltaproteobacteria bacterium]